MEAKNIRDMSSEEFKTFLDSFDTILTDCDGVLWLNDTPITGALQTLQMLESYGKKVIFVSNHSARSVDDYVIKFRRMGYEATADQIILPSQAVVWYLKKIGFQGKAYVLGTEPFKQVLADNDIEIVTGPNSIEENMMAIINVLKPQPDVKAVIVDFDLNLNWAKLLQTASILKRKDVLFLIGPRDKNLPISESQSLIGPGYFIDILINHTGRTPVEFAKPCENLKNYLIERFKITNPARCIFIGDSLAADIKFADLCGFLKLWVSSGVDSVEALKNNCEVIPDYYLPNLGIMRTLNQEPSGSKMKK
ncbi:uncharacterized protein LOC130663453 [Microplitis mediator]|uniref:uncharacterized protein LOC130663453 n=1 Tax=Microplitis mediator TaxID=375433 RepID=UPI002554D7BF|nr:uncharacterized protein LOC130663453 [Microplitis mediator]